MIAWLLLRYWLVQRTITAVISVYLDGFHDSLINVVRKLGRKLRKLWRKTIKLKTENSEDQHGGYGYWARNKENERIIEFCAAMNMTLGNTLFKKSASHIVSYEPGISKALINFWLVIRNFLKNIKVLPCEECSTQKKPLVCDFNIRKVKETRNKFVPRRKIWKLDEYSVKSDSKSYINKYIASSQKDTSDKHY